MAASNAALHTNLCWSLDSNLGEEEGRVRGRGGGGVGEGTSLVRREFRCKEGEDEDEDDDFVEPETKRDKQNICA